jgi:hypothetical protein
MTLTTRRTMMAQTTTSKKYQGLVELFADAWIAGEVGVALDASNEAEKLWREQFLERQQEAAKAWSFEWPLPGCPEADEASGWGEWTL